MAINTARSKNKESAKAVAAPLPCGLVIFDNPNEALSGSVYLPNSPSSRIRSVNDLRNDALWISNLSFARASEEQHPNLRSNFYFKVGLDEIAHDLGMQCPASGQLAPEDAQKISVILTRTMTIAARAYGWDVSDLGPLRVQEPFLDSDISKMLASPPTPDSRLRQEITHALTQANQRISVPAWTSMRYEQDSVYVTLRYNRVSYVRQLLAQAIPSGSAWVRIEGADIDDPKVIEKCVSAPSLVKATIEWDSASSEIAALTAVGRMGRFKNTMRHWFSQPELIWLSQYADITVSCIWFDKGEKSVLGEGANLPDIFNTHPEIDLSYSAGLVAMSHLHAMCSGKWSAKHRLEESNVWATWLRAMDRAQMFSAAVRAYNAGFHISSYGMGALRLRVRRDQLSDLVAFKEKEGFMYPDLDSLTTHKTVSDLLG